MFFTSTRPFMSGLRAVYLACAMALAILACLKGIELHQSAQALMTSGRDNLQWSVLQIRLEYDALIDASEATLSDAPESVSDFRTRFDIFFSRVSLLETAPVMAALRQDREFNLALGAMRGLIDRLAALVDTPQQTPVLRREISSLLKANRTLSIDVSESALAAISRSSDAARLEQAQRLKLMAMILISLFAMMMLGMLLLAYQTSQLRNREKVIVEERERFSAIVHAALDAVVVANREGTIIEWNSAAERTFGHSAAEAIGRNVDELIAFDAAMSPGAPVHLARLAPNINGQRIELEARHRLGDRFPIELALGTTQSADKPIFVAYIRDITERKLATASLKLARDRAEAAGRAKADFLAIMSHEMRTPLNGVIGIMDLLAKTSLTAQQAEYVEIALQAGDALLAQINDVLDLSKLDAGKLDLEHLPFRLDSVVSSVFAIMTPQAEACGNTLRCTIDDNVPMHFLGDATRLRQVLLNLISNAVKFTEQGDIALRFERLDSAEGRLQLRGQVSDTGIGIPAERLGELFKEFNMLDQSSTRRVGGTGLGLAICKRLIGLMGGDITVASTPGVGSTFSFTLFLEQDNAEGIGAQPPAPQTTIAHRLRVLVAEDNPVNQLVIGQMLGQLGHEVTIVANGREAVEAVVENDYDVVLMDASMPEMDGIEAARRIRALAAPVASIPILAVTAHAIAGDRERFIAAGMDGYMTKPIRRATLEARLASIDQRSVPVSTTQGDELSPMDEPEFVSLRELRELTTEISEDVVPIVVDQFLGEMQTRLKQIQSARNVGDIVRLQKEAHALSGAAATLGASRLHKICKSIEVLAKSGQDAAALEAAGPIDAVVVGTLEAYRSLNIGHALT